MFHRLVAVEPLNITLDSHEEVKKRAEEFIYYDTLPQSEEDVIRRAQGADGILVSYTTKITANIIEHCPELKYIGMCCSLYDENSASVDIRCAREHGITVLGVSDYGDEGVGEYVIAELTSLLHGFRGKMWGDSPLELTGLPVGIIGMGATGKVVAKALKFFGADVTYYSRSRKPEMEDMGVSYLPLPELLQKNICLCTCLNKFVTLLGEEEFKLFGNHRILFNTGLSTSSHIPALKKWLAHGDNYYFCDSTMGLEDPSLMEMPNVSCLCGSAGSTYQATIRLSEKSIRNMDNFLNR